MLPEGWKKKSFGDVVNIANGLIDPREISFKDIKHIGPENVISNTGRIVNEKTCGDLKLISGKYEFDANSIVYSKIRPNLNKVCTPSYSGVCSADMYVLHPRKGIDKSFLFFSILGNSFKNSAISMSMRTGMPKINREDLSSIPILLPPLPEQKKIAAILSTWDRAIEGTEKLLANSQQQKKALMQQLLTGKKRLPGFTGEWENIALGELEKKGFLELGRGNVISKKDIAAHPGQNPIYSSSVKNCGLMGTYGHYMFDEELISWSVDGGGHFFHRKKHKFSITNVSGYMRVDQKNLNYKFLCSQLQFLHEKLHFDYQTKAHPSVIRDLYILNIPTLPEQRAIAAILTTTDEEIAALKSDLSRLRQEKKALMQQLLTGKIRVAV